MSTKDLLTVRDFIRYAVSRFQAAGLVYAHGTETAFDEAVFMVLEGLHLPVDRLDPFLDARLTVPERARLAKLIEARIKTRKPAAYLLNKAYIRGIPFYVDERVIVPRSYIGEILTDPDSSLVPDPEGVARVLDLCTGSGCLAIVAAGVFPFAQVDAVDLSKDAVEVARRNVREHGLEGRVEVLRGDLFAPLTGRVYDLIITNPPYVDADGVRDLPPECRHEPKMAFAAGADGTAIVARILAEAARHLAPQGGILAEVGRCRGALERLYPRLPFLWLETENSRDEVFWLTRKQLEKNMRA